MKIVLFGDSIRQLGYGNKVEEELRKYGYDVFQPEDNCRFAKYTLRMIFDYKEQIKDANIIHFNVGHWDLCNINEDGENFSTLEEYEMNIRRILKAFFKITPKVIFATTTPVRENHPYNSNDDIVLYNKKAIEIMNEYGVKVNDLYSLLKDDVNRYIREDDLIHLTDEGINKCAKQVIKSIKEIM